MLYTIVVGDSEVRKGSLSVRKHGKQVAQALAVADFIEMLIKEKHLLY